MNTIQVLQGLVSTIPVAMKSCRNLLGLVKRSKRILNNSFLHHQPRREIHAKFVNGKQEDDGNCASAEDDNFTVSSLSRRWCRRFEQEKISEPIESTEYIIAHVLGIAKVTDLINFKEMKLNQEQLEKLNVLCNCRLSRMPVQYIIGEWDFRDVTLKLEPPIFIPRPETEILVDLVLKRLELVGKKLCSLLEIGCGSGAISLSLLRSKNNLKVVALDVNPQACDLTYRNAKELKLENSIIILNAALHDDASFTLENKHCSKQTSVDINEEKFDIIVSNPPYIPIKEIFKLEPEIVLYEDVKALDGGDDGLKLIKPIIKYASKALNPNGRLYLEVDSSHPKMIKSLLESNYSHNLKLEHICKDFYNRDRFVEIGKMQ